jgi:trigger factor
MANVALPAANYLPADQRAVGADRGGLRHVVAVVVAHQEDGVEDAEQAPPIDNFSEAAEKRVALGLLLRQLIIDKELKVDEALVRARVEEMVSGYENADDMVTMYMSNPQVMQQIEPMVVEQLAIDWIIEHGDSKTKKVSFKECMNAPSS